ncbi:hypothetical protein FACS1894204_11070 [Synergistales bacterium]|nr:hypothetical protein FACS1894204_11070 [Synergistales bacterium]
MLQVQAGYLLDCVKAVLSEGYERDTVQHLLRSLCCFDLDVQEKERDIHNPTSVLAVVNNIISRGLPTRPPLSVETELLTNFAPDIFAQDEEASRVGAIQFNLDADALRPYLFRALHLIDPRLSASDFERAYTIDRQDYFDSSFEQDFLLNKVPAFLSPYWMQLIETQRAFSELSSYSSDVSADDYFRQRIDFSIEFPYPINSYVGLAIEVDGSQHEQKDQTHLDNRRDKALSKLGWMNTLRLKTGEWDDLRDAFAVLEELQEHEYFKMLDENYTNPLYNCAEGIDALHLALVPFAVARIQKAIVHMLLQNQISIDDKEWAIACIERDVPCAQLAFRELQIWFDAIFELCGQDCKFPKIRLYVDNKSSCVSPNYKTKCKPINRKNKKGYDIYIDCAILERGFVTAYDKNIRAKTTIGIRSSRCVRGERVFATDTNIKYLPLGEKNKREDRFIADKKKIGLLKIFLSDIFRKVDFHSGQIAILDRALRCEDVVGLLPTGAGKSLTYQMAALLQPGIALVIDPLKSLMLDQYEGLAKNGIDCAVYINSSLNPEERIAATRKIGNTQILFAFLSPERLQIAEFRSVLSKATGIQKHSFSYCVVDEAHCVSEWGHDFRTAYLKLGSNARRFCKTKSGLPTSFIALTATASYDVLSDIQRELDIHTEDAIVRSENMERPELSFEICPVAINEKPANKYALRLVVGQAKLQILKKIVTEQCHDGLFKRTGVVFCPHATGLFGVHAGNYEAGIAETLVNIVTDAKLDLSIGTYAGSAANGQDRDTHEDINISNQKGFIENKLDLLVATKAFGMGIDKPNIRYTVHVNYPSSIEGFYQEAGRAGRDRRNALCIIIFEEFGAYDKQLMMDFHSNNFKGMPQELAVLRELLTGIRFPRASVLAELENIILDEYDKAINLTPKINKTNRKVLYLNPCYGSMYLDTPAYDYYGQKENIPEIATRIRQWLRDVDTEGKDLWDFICEGDVTDQTVDDGIENKLSDPNNKGTFSVVIPFENDSTEEITRQLQSNTGGNSTAAIRKNVGSACAYCSDADEFLSKLRSGLSKDRISINLDSETEEIIKRLFLEIRTQDSTFKAVYRLSILGVIQDYTVDYNAKLIHASVEKHSQGYYTENLRAYLSKYNATERVDAMIASLPQQKGDTEIQKCLTLLVHFTYEEIAAQRRMSIDAMEDACKVGLQKDGPERFRTFIYMYMNSKYAQAQYLPKDTNNGLLAEFATVKKYIALVRSHTGGEINNLRHLRGAATLMQVQRPDNFVFQMLKAFSVFILEKDDQDFISEAQDEYYSGFLTLLRLNNGDARAVMDASRFFKEEIAKFNSDAVSAVEEAEETVLHKIHLDWLTQYNKTSESESVDAKLTDPAERGI